MLRFVVMSVEDVCDQRNAYVRCCLVQFAVSSMRSFLWASFRDGIWWRSCCGFTIAYYAPFSLCFGLLRNRYHISPKERQRRHMLTSTQLEESASTMLVHSLKVTERREKRSQFSVYIEAPKCSILKVYICGMFAVPFSHIV